MSEEREASLSAKQFESLARQSACEFLFDELHRYLKNREKEQESNERGEDNKNFLVDDCYGEELYKELLPAICARKELRQKAETLLGVSLEFFEEKILKLIFREFLKKIEFDLKYYVLVKTEYILAYITNIIFSNSDYWKEWSKKAETEPEVEASKEVERLNLVELFGKDDLGDFEPFSHSTYDLFIPNDINEFKEMIEKLESIGDGEGQRYKIIRNLGRGGLGEVFLCLDLNLGRLVAVKRVLFANNDQKSDLAVMQIKRLQREAKVMGEQHSRFITKIYDVFWLPNKMDETENKNLVLVMEYVKGRSLDRLIKERDKNLKKGLTDEEVATIMMQVCVALGEMHKGKKLHRDIKPGNIFLDETGDAQLAVKLGDLGLVYFLGEKSIVDSEKSKQPAYAWPPKNITRDGCFAGDLNYIPREIVCNSEDKISVPTDLYSLGATMYEMLSFLTIFQADNKEDLLDFIVHFSPEELSDLGFNTIFEDILNKLLSKFPEDRYQSAKEVFEVIKKAMIDAGYEMVDPDYYVWKKK